ncbi:cytochrome P450 [Proteobacteria bacterium 005FR1]|nr:cytochrome P450 [Proteobacteria bacterium 005FR1]
MNELMYDGKHDNTLALLSEGYNFIRNRCAQHDTDVFATRLILKPVVCVMGEEAAKMFYSPGRFTRVGAMPPTTLMLLQDKGSVQLKEGAAHAQRKQLFMSMMTPVSLARLAEQFRTLWRERSEHWAEQREVCLHEEVRTLLCDAACRWSGIELTPHELRQRSHEMGAMIDAAGSFGPKNWWSLMLRSRTEHWAQGLIEDVRSEKRPASPATPLHRIAWHREDGELLGKDVAAVELINVIRPTMAIARFLTFAALALHEYPACRERLRFGNPEYLHWFVQEVRRFYPFFPMIGGRAVESFDWQGHHFEENTWFLLDLYGTNHDPRSWNDPDTFEPERFRDWNGSAYNFIPQGGGEYIAGHRCAGEWLTIELMKAGVELMATEMRYRVPRQDLSVSLTKIPALPRSGFAISDIEPISREFQHPASATIHNFPEQDRRKGR